MKKKAQTDKATLPQFGEDYSQIVGTDEQPEPTPINKEEALRQLQTEAVTTLRYLLYNGGETTRLRAAIWLLERADKKEPVGMNFVKGELSIGFDDDEED